MRSQLSRPTITALYLTRIYNRNNKPKFYVGRTQYVNGHIFSGGFSSLQLTLLSGLNFPDCLIFKMCMWLQFNTGSVLDNFNVLVVAVPLQNIFLSVTLLCDVRSTMGIKMEALRWTAKTQEDYSRILGNTLRKTVILRASNLVKWNPVRHRSSPSF